MKGNGKVSSNRLVRLGTEKFVGIIDIFKS